MTGTGCAPLKIGQMINSLGVGGAEKLLVTFAAIARERGISLSVITLANAGASRLLQNLLALDIPVHPIHSRKLADPVRFARLIRLLQQERFDVLHTHLETANILGVLAGRVTGTPVVSTLHLASLNSSAARRTYMETLALGYGASQIMAVGPSVAQVHQRRIGRPIRVIRNPTLPLDQLSKADREAARKEIMGPTASVLVISVGRLVATKGHLDLLSAFSQIHREWPLVSLAIVGEGVMDWRLEAQIAALGLQNSIALLGLREDIPRLLAAADIYVSASHVEGLSLSILEAMAAGLPVVATAVGDTPSIINEETGVIVPPHDPAALARAISALLADPDYSRALGERARAYVLRYHDPDVWMDQLLALYTEIAYTNGDTHPRRGVFA